jgi:hypothetical protein
MLDFVDETLYQMTFLVEVLVILSALLSILARRNDNFRFFVNNHLDEIVSVIGTISDYSLKVIVGDQCFCLRDIMSLTSGQTKAQWVAQGVNIHVNLGVEPTPAASKCLLRLPTVSWGAPAAQGCALITVLSKITLSMSGHSAKC